MLAAVTTSAAQAFPVAPLSFPRESLVHRKSLRFWFTRVTLRERSLARNDGRLPTPAGPTPVGVVFCIPPRRLIGSLYPPDVLRSHWQPLEFIPRLRSLPIVRPGERFCVDLITHPLGSFLAALVRPARLHASSPIRLVALTAPRGYCFTVFLDSACRLFDPCAHCVALSPPGDTVFDCHFGNAFS